MRLNDSGASILAVILLLSILTVTGAVFVSLFITGVEESVGEASSTRALYSAEAGLEAAVGHLKKSPLVNNWIWRDGYLDKAAGSGKVDVEILEYEQRDGTLAGTNRCEPIESTIVTTGANPSRTVYVYLTWDTTANLGVELYNNTVADCNNPLASASLIASSLTNGKPERIRYRIPDAAPATLNYTVRVVGSAGDTYRLSISHPDESGFSSGTSCGQPAGAPFDKCMRAVISLGKSGKARREVFTGLSKN